jgi:hypothetical protein
MQEAAHITQHSVYSPLPPSPKPIFHCHTKSTPKTNSVTPWRAMRTQATRICKSRIQCQKVKYPKPKTKSDHPQQQRITTKPKPTMVRSHPPPSPHRVHRLMYYKRVCPNPRRLSLCIQIQTIPAQAPDRPPPGVTLLANYTTAQLYHFSAVHPLEDISKPPFHRALGKYPASCTNCGSYSLMVTYATIVIIPGIDTLPFRLFKIIS